MKKFNLVQNMRARDDEDGFSDWLIQLGNGTLHTELPTANEDTITVPTQCIAKQSLVTELYGEMTADNVQEHCSRVILCPKNVEALDLNEEVLQQLPGDSNTYASVDTAVLDDQQESDSYPLEFLHSLTPSGMPPHLLNLKVGAVAMLLRNLNIQQGLCNGTCLLIRRLHRNVIDAEVLLGTHAGKRVLIPRVILAPSDTDLPFILRCRQFPLWLAWAMMINKAQGQTFDMVGIHLAQPVFTHGQLYVAFSRAKSFSDIRVAITPTPRQGKQGDVWTTTNIVFHEVL